MSKEYREQQIQQARKQHLEAKEEKKRQNEEKWKTYRWYYLAIAILFTIAFIYAEMKYPDTPTNTEPAWKTQDRARRSIEASETLQSIK